MVSGGLFTGCLRPLNMSSLRKDYVCFVATGNTVATNTTGGIMWIVLITVVALLVLIKVLIATASLDE